MIQHCECCGWLVSDVGQVLCSACWVKARKFFDMPVHIFGRHSFGQNTPFSWKKVPGMYENEGNI